LIKPLIGAGAPFGRPFVGRKPTGGVTVPFPFAFSVEELMLAARVEGVRIWRVDDSSRRCVANWCDNEGHGRESEEERPQMGGRSICIWRFSARGCDGKTLRVWEW